jgi:hypothetical protein
MFYPKCPVCGSSSESIEPCDIDRGNRSASHALHVSAMQGHPHPVMKALSVGITIGRQIYKRVPGGGEKRCTSCGHTFR